jgi:hypothetical protein
METALMICLMSDARLLDVHDVHDDSTFEHLGQAGLETERWGAEVAVGGVVCHDESPWEPRLLGCVLGFGPRESSVYQLCWQLMNFYLQG